MSGDGIQIGRDVSGDVGTPMNPTDSAGGEHRDSPGGGDGHRGRHRRGSEFPTLCHRDGDVTFGHLASRAQDSRMLGVLQTETHDAVENRGHRRNASGIADGRRTTIERFGVER